MNIVYLILAHQNPIQLKKLIEKLDYKNNSFVIHYDLNASEHEYRSLQEMFKNKKNIYFSKRYKCYWGDRSLVEASIECLKTVYKNEINFDYAVLISGQHYPIKDNKQIEEYFNAAANNSFINYFKVPSTKEWVNEGGGVNRIIYYHFNKHPRKRFCRKRILNRGITLLLKKIGVKRKPPIEISKFYGGSQWWSLTNECCAYVLKFIQERPDVFHYFKYVHVPDEMFFQTVLLNSKYKGNIINNNLTYIYWDVIPSESPVTLDETHFDKIKDSSDLWARKFDTVKSEKLIRLLERDKM
ncbi:MAG TPA: beta-1,6-N-acetylglucosaminyltransferase [Bacillus sp. (in: firmicutes)]|nr:beta-1,6-N-acetylglucosaminyltransferase [Bacillus sp. (in: firmicutes)]